MPNLVRVAAALVFAISALIALPAQAQVLIAFHSFNGSLFGKRYPHAFVVFEGTLDETGERVDENYGFSARTAGPSALVGPVRHMVYSENPKYITTTNRHFAIPISDALYHQMKAEIARWRDAPGKFYDLKTRNCIHFVGKMAEMAGLKVEFPKKMLRKPKAWLNFISRLNPRLHAREID